MSYLLDRATESMNTMPGPARPWHVHVVVGQASRLRNVDRSSPSGSRSPSSEVDEAVDRLRAAGHQVLAIVGFREICSRISRVIAAQAGTKGLG
jgi:hypothetical protein